MKAPLILLFVLALAGLTACGDGQDPVISGDATTTTAAGAGGFALTTVSTPPTERGLLEDVEVLDEGEFDRVTFTFEGAVPGYRVGYVERPLVEGGSGNEVAVDGAAVLAVHLEPASGFDLTGEGRQVYEGPTRLEATTSVVVDVVRVTDFEANLDWAIGVDSADTPFRVRVDGRSIIIDLRH